MKYLPAILEALAALTSFVVLAWPFVYPPAELPTTEINSVCLCCQGGDCICDPCPCRESCGDKLEVPQ